MRRGRPVRTSWENLSGAGVPPAFGASGPCNFAGETAVHRRPEARATIFQTSAEQPLLHSRAKILGRARYPSPALRAPSPLRGERDGVRGPFACESQRVSKLIRNHIANEAVTKSDSP